MGIAIRTGGRGGTNPRRIGLIIGGYVQPILGRLVVSQGDLETSLLHNIQALSGFFVEQLTGLATNLFLLIMNFLVMLFTLFFFFKDGDRLYRNLYEVVPLDETHKKKIFTRLDVTLRAVVKGVIITAMVQGLLAGLGVCGIGRAVSRRLNGADRVAGSTPIRRHGHHLAAGRRVSVLGRPAMESHCHAGLGSRRHYHGREFPETHAHRQRRAIARPLPLLQHHRRACRLRHDRSLLRTHLISHSHDGDSDLSRRIFEEGKCEGSGRVSGGRASQSQLKDRYFNSLRRIPML